MRSGKYCSKTGEGAAIFLAAVLEFICAEVIEIAVFDMNKKYLDWLNNVTGSF